MSEQLRPTTDLTTTQFRILDTHTVQDQTNYLSAQVIWDIDKSFFFADLNLQASVEFIERNGSKFIRKLEGTARKMRSQINLYIPNEYKDIALILRRFLSNISEVENTNHPYNTNHGRIDLNEKSLVLEIKPEEA